MTEDAAIEARVKAALGKLDATYEWIEIDPVFADTAQFCAQYGFDLDRCANTIIVASKK
jgi:prolyl-tRNA editing enzyme YbaK/EbsC (Cys-tRNA(Pro) deacylase)